jgi:low temperature requirement protein LtrA
VRFSDRLAIIGGMTDVLGRMGLRPMRARDARASHRVATPLELLFDLVFVVAVSQASSNLHHLIADDHVGQGVVAYLMIFFAVWLPWVNFTWFGSAFDTDDWLYRVLTFVQMGGMLVLAAGVHDAMVDFDFVVVTWGYVIIRLALVSQWLRAAWSEPRFRATALRYATGIGALQLLWVLRLSFVQDLTLQIVSFLALAAAEMLVPLWAERARATSWHPHHIAERYGLFTLLLLGESLLASANAIIDALSEGEHVAELLGLAACGVVVTAGMWWVYFAREQHESLTGPARGFPYGYVHYVIFAAVGAVSAGVEVGIDEVAGASLVSKEVAGLALTIPIGLFLASSWALLLRPQVAPWVSALTLAGAVSIVASGVLPIGGYVGAAALLVVVIVAIEVDGARRRSAVELQ